MVGELQGLVGDFGTIADALRVLAGGLKTLLEDFNRGLKTIGIFKRSLPQERCARKESVRPTKRKVLTSNTYRHGMQLPAPNTQTQETVSVSSNA